jgi:predicted transcriptional regulator
VLVDKNFNRVKIKSSAYVFMSSRRDSLGKSNKARIELIQNDAVDDVLSSLPEFVQGKILGLQRKLKTLVQTCDALYQAVKDEDTDKDFALKVQHGGYSSVMFALRRGKAVDSWEHFKRMSPKRVLEYLDEEDDEEETVCE